MAKFTVPSVCNRCAKRLEEGDDVVVMGKATLGKDDRHNSDRRLRVKFDGPRKIVVCSDCARHIFLNSFSTIEDIKYAGGVNS